MPEQITKGIITAEMWDKMQFLFRNFYDRMVHTVLYFDGEIDTVILTRAYEYMIKRVPILHSSFVNRPVTPYWKINENYEIKDVIELIETENPEKAVNDFITREIKVDATFQIKAAVIRCKGKDILCELINHMCMDGGDTQQFNRNLTEVYNDYYLNKDTYLEIKNGSRSHYQIYSKFNDADKKTAKSLYRNVSAVKDKTKFPFTEKSGDKGRIVREILQKETFLAMKAKSKESGASINDIILACYLRSLYKICDINANEKLSVPCMVDLRRHIEGGKSYGFSNHVGFMVCTLDKFDKDVNETVRKVKEASATAKSDKFLGLYSLPLLNLAYEVFPQCLAEIAIRIGYTNPYTGMSNIGVLKEEDYTFGGLKPSYAWMTGAIKKKPYMQLAMVTYNNEITFSIAVECNDRDEAILQRFLRMIKKEIQTFIECSTKRYD